MTTASQKNPGAQSPEPTPPPVIAAEGVITAAMKEGAGTPREWAQAEHDAGILFDPKRAQDIDQAAREQAHAEDAADLEGLRAELQAAREELAGMAGANRQRAATVRLLEGRPGDYHLPVALVAAAIEYGATPYDEMPPMTLSWDPDPGIGFPDGATRTGRAVISCHTPYGTRADLVVEGDDWTKLASLVGTQLRDIHAPCPTELCGTDSDLDASNPFLFGWSRLQIASLAEGPRWYCSDMCVFDALARAGHDLAADDQAAAVDPHQQGHTAPAAAEEAARRSVDRAFPAVAAFLADERADDAATAEALEAEARLYPEAVVDPGLPYGGDLLAEETRSYPEAALDGADDRDSMGGAW